MKEPIQKPSKFINLRTDFGFKKLFFEDPNKDLLIAFLNALFKGRKVIKDLMYNKTEFPGDITSEGSIIFDLACTGEEGERSSSKFSVQKRTISKRGHCSIPAA